MEKWVFEVSAEQKRDLLMQHLSYAQAGNFSRTQVYVKYLDKLT